MIRANILGTNPSGFSLVSNKLVDGWVSDELPAGVQSTFFFPSTVLFLMAKLHATTKKNAFLRLTGT